MLEALLIAAALEGAKAIGQQFKDRISEAVSEEVKLVWSFKDKLEELESKFLNLQLFLQDVGSTKHADKDKRRQVINWLLQVRDAGFVADDIIDDYHYEIVRREREEKKENTMEKIANKVRTALSHDNHLLFRTKMSHKVRDALAEFDKLDKMAQRMGLKPSKITADGMAANYDEGKDILSQTRRLACANAAEFVGREVEKETLLKEMRTASEKEDQISAVVIHGIGGLGKTTFASRLYESTDAFQKKFWISVGQDFSILRILNEMLQYFTGGYSSNINAIIEKLGKELKTIKYLLVLDDVWCQNNELWSSLKNALERIGGLPGCLILITARFSEVATASQAVYKHRLRGLSEDESWVLLKKSVSVDGTSPNSILEEIGKRILKKCNGVPLAIKAIGSTLRSKEQIPREWESIEKSEIWELPINDENQILPSLRLTFNHLPSSSLKQCFAYCPAFCRKGDLMKKDELVDIWLAQGFLYGSEIKNLTMEEIREKYLMVLLNYSLLDEVKGGYKMHDLVYDLAVDVSGKDLLFWKPKDKPEDEQKIDGCRHLVIDKKNVEALSNLPVTKTLTKLRTISNGLPDNVLKHAEYLRTLSVDGCGIENLSSFIDSCTHLRFLSLSRNPIKTLPDSIKKLYLLQTLRLLDCSDMKVLPAILYKLTNLIHIRTTTPMLASRGLRKLTKLCTLPRLALGDDKDGWTIDELGALQNLMGDIHISGLEHVKTKEDATKADLAGKAKVSNITLAWAEKREESSGGSNDEEVLDGLQPHPNITSLELHNFFGEMLPSWMVRMAVVSEGGSSSPLKNLTTFKLLNWSRCKKLPTLGHLPCLKYLLLSGFKVESIDSDFYGISLNESNESFPSLKELEVSSFRSLKTWDLPSTGEETIVFPCLEVIKITDCPELETIPTLKFQSLKTLKLSNVGIQSLEITKQNPSSMLLATLEVSDCPALTSLPNDLFQGLTSLRRLSIYRCEALSNIPTSLEKCVSLATLTIVGCPSIKDPAPDFSKLKGLVELYKSGNPIDLMSSMLKAIPELPNLKNLIVGGFNETDQELYFSDVSLIQQHQSLFALHLVGEGRSDIKSLPKQLQCLTKIKVLTIYNFNSLEGLPSWLGNLLSLEILWLRNCKNLKDIPSKDVFSKRLRQLFIRGCPNLVKSCDDGGSDWSKISHVPFIDIDHKTIQNKK